MLTRYFRSPGAVYARTRRTTVPSAETRGRQFTRLSFAKTQLMPHSSQLILLALPAIDTTTSYASRSSTAGMIHPVQGLIVRVYTCSWFGIFCSELACLVCTVLKDARDITYTGVSTSGGHSASSFPPRLQGSRTMIARYLTPTS